MVQLDTFYAEQILFEQIQSSMNGMPEQKKNATAWYPIATVIIKFF